MRFRGDRAEIILHPELIKQKYRQIYGTNQARISAFGKRRRGGKKMAGVTRLELATSCVTGRRSNRLSYTPDKGRRNLPEICCRSSELEKNDPGNRRQGGGCGEHRRRNVPLPESVGDGLPPARLCQPPNIASFQIECPSPVSGQNPGKNQGIKWRRGRDSNPRYLFK